MDDLELAWETYDFHTYMLHELEVKHHSVMEYYQRFVKRNLNPSQAKKTYARNKINKSFSAILTSYGKQLKSIDDLIKIYKIYKVDGIPLPEGREIDPQLFITLKNVTATLMEEVKILRKEINEVLR